MTDAPRNGNGTVTGAVRAVSTQLIGSLGPQFLMLLLINLVFVGMLFWHEHQSQVLRTEAINKLIDRCLVQH